jgi:hypothetical protein
MASMPLTTTIKKNEEILPVHFRIQGKARRHT